MVWLWYIVRFSQIYNIFVGSGLQLLYALLVIDSPRSAEGQPGLFFAYVYKGHRSGMFHLEKWLISLPRAGCPVQSGSFEKAHGVNR
jgi:hypothetical protein